MPSSADGSCSASPAPAIASAMTPSCWRQRSRPAPAITPSISAPASAPLVSPWRSRIDGLTVTLVEIDPALAALAGENAARNGLGERVRAACLDVVAPAAAFAAAGLPPGTADRVLMNPPFNAAQNPSPDRGRRLAHVAANETLRGLAGRGGAASSPASGGDADLARRRSRCGAGGAGRRVRRRHPVAALSKARCGGNSGARPRGQGKPCAAVVAAGLHARRRGGKSHRRGASGTTRKCCVSLGW